ncbi:PIN domain-containing protein [Pseudaquabacterium rugosum]|uniref:PIN domain-containing protein n=1 Tax=Pseudaquabacterium rugosum TaxID=2984194 RepID=A0ABU9BGR1_9BURK
MNDLPSPASPPTPLWILDSNVVLDWWLFASPIGLALGSAIQGGRARWLRTAAMRDELSHVLAHRDFGRWTTAARALQPPPTELDQYAQEIPPPPTGGAHEIARWRCRDPDDQKFIDLARSQPGCWLLSRDRAVLKLASKARAAGFHIVVPEQVPLNTAG